MTLTQFSLIMVQINFPLYDIVVKPLQSFSFKSVTPFQTKFKTPIKKNKRFSQLFLDDSTNLISLYNKHPTVQNYPSTPDFYALLLKYVFLSDCLKLFLTNFMNILILVLKLLIIHSPNITTFHLSKNGFPFSYMTVLNVNVINTSI